MFICNCGDTLRCIRTKPRYSPSAKQCKNMQPEDKWHICDLFSLIIGIKCFDLLTAEQTNRGWKTPTSKLRYAQRRWTCKWKYNCRPRLSRFIIHTISLFSKMWIYRICSCTQGARGLITHLKVKLSPLPLHTAVIVSQFCQKNTTKHDKFTESLLSWSLSYSIVKYLGFLYNEETT